MIHIRIGADIECIDGKGGELTQLVVDRASRRITHLVVERTGFGKDERLVPVDQVAEGSTHRISLRCSRDALAAMEPLIETQYRMAEPGMYPAGMYQSTGGHMPSGAAVISYRQTNLSDDSRPVGQGMRVQAQDGPVGKVYELIIDSSSAEITHFSLVDGRLWRKKAITLPLTAVERVSDDTIYLTLDKQAVGELPAVSLAELDRTAVEDQYTDVTNRLQRLESDWAVAGQDTKATLGHEIERLRRKQAELRSQLR